MLLTGNVIHISLGVRQVRFTNGGRHSMTTRALEAWLIGIGTSNGRQRHRAIFLSEG